MLQWIAAIEHHSDWSDMQGLELQHLTAKHMLSYVHVPKFVNGDRNMARSLKILLLTPEIGSARHW